MEISPSLLKGLTGRSKSEQKPQPNLDLAGGVGSGSKGRSSSRKHFASAVEESQRVSCHIGIVQDIKHLYPKLGLQLLTPKVLVLEHSEIQIPKHRHAHDIPAFVSQLSGDWIGKATGPDVVANVAGSRTITAWKIPQQLRPLSSIAASHLGAARASRV